MAIGIAGDSIISIGGLPAPDLDTIELRVISNLLANLLAGPQNTDDIGVLRNDQAFELSIPTPLPGANM